MSIKAITWAIERSLPSSAKLVLILLANYANHEKLCWPSISEIQEKSALDRRTIQRILNGLQTSNLITRLKNKKIVVKRQKYQVNIYKLNF